MSNARLPTIRTTTGNNAPIHSSVIAGNQPGCELAGLFRFGFKGDKPGGKGFELGNNGLISQMLYSITAHSLLSRLNIRHE